MFFHYQQSRLIFVVSMLHVCIEPDLFYPQSPDLDIFKDKSPDSLSSGIHLTVASNDTMSMSPETELAVPQDWIPPESLIYSPPGCCVEACASLRSRTVWRVRARWRDPQKSRGTGPIQSYLEARGQKQTTVHSEMHMCFPFSNSSISHFHNKCIHVT